MKALIIYYSYSGNTDKVAKIFAEVLRRRGEVDIQRLKPKNEITNFFSQCKAAFTRKRAELPEGVKFDASPYDLMIIGSPVWAFSPTPAINTYLDKVSGLIGKRVITLLTSGSGVGVKRCFGHIRSVLKGKGAKSVEDINIPDIKLGDEDFIRSSLERIL